MKLSPQLKHLYLCVDFKYCNYDINKLKEEGNKFDKQLKQERFRNVPIEIINLLKNDIINHILHEIKISKSDNIPARILSHWIKEKVVITNPDDARKNKCFDKMHSIWLNIVAEARRFGISLDDLKIIQECIMTSPIPDFNYLKLGLLYTILNEPQILELSKSGSCSIESLSEYKSNLNANLLPHLVIPLNTLKKEFPKANFNLPLEISDCITDEHKLVLTFILKTGCFDFIKIFLSSTDVRYSENLDFLKNNSDLKQEIINWNFKKIEIILEDGTLAIIDGNL